ncbi:hypothetical protein HSX11_05360 [Oxalobacteraceae bacterium]|nr:hypothetical protein [Oxalobacteraceae bacterium]
MLDWIIDVLGWIARTLVYQIVGILLEKIFYWPGWLMLRLITFGRYPPRADVKHHRLAVGLFALTVIAFASALYMQFAK